MFLLNSRSPLVTATSLSLSWHSFSRSYRAILPSSFAVLCPSHLRLLTQGHLCQFSVRSPLRLFTGPWPHSSFAPAFSIFSPLRFSDRLSNASTPHDRRARTSPSRHHIAEGHTNINAFPFRTSRLRMSLGPANPRLMNIAEEPWPLRWCGFSPHYAATLPWILIRRRSTRSHNLASTRPRRRATPSPFGGSAYRYSV